MKKKKSGGGILSRKMHDLKNNCFTWRTRASHGGHARTTHATLGQHALRAKDMRFARRTRASREGHALRAEDTCFARRT